MASNLRGYTPFELFNKVLNTDNDALQVDIVDATGVTVTVDSEFPAAAALADNAANPTTTSVGSFLMGYDSGNTNWNRVEVDDDGNLQVDVVSTPGDDSIVTLGTTTYSETSSKGTAIGGVRNDILASLADTDNEWAPLQFNSSGALYIDVANGGVLESAVDGIETLLGTIDSDTDAIKTAVQTVDDWDESDRAAVNLIPSQAGVAAGAGGVNALTQRVILANDDPAVVDLAAMEVLLGTIDSDTNDIKTATELIDDSIYADDADWTNNSSKHVLVGGVRNDTPNSITDGNTGPIALDEDGAVHIADGGNVISIDDGGSTISIDDASGSITVDGSVSITSLPASTDTIEIVGDVAENYAAAGNPVLSGGRYDSPGNDNATVRSLDDNDVGALALDPTGALYVREYLGQTGSCFVSGTAAVTAAIGKFVAIQFLEDTVFNGTDGLVATDSGRWPDDTDAATDISSSNTAAVGSQVFPQGMTIFGRWDSFILVSGAVIAYVGNV